MHKLIRKFQNPVKVPVYVIRVPPFIFRIFNGIGEIRKSLGYNMVSVLLSLLLSPKFKI
ncbi:Uncharacterised protein [Streptococcus pneumoniae]|nr:Uncharacterised protein [Streptococcus pneumoniae]